MPVVRRIGLEPRVTTRHRDQPLRRHPHPSCRRSGPRRPPFPGAGLLFEALGIVLFFASCVVMFAALIAAASLDVWAGAFGGLLSVVTAVVGYGLVCRWLP